MEKAFEICLEMLQQRGYYHFEQNDEQNYTIMINEKDEKIIIFLCDTLKFNIQYIQQYMTQMYDNNILHSVIIYKNSITPFVKKIIEDNIDELNIELFSKDILQFNITKHCLVPKHECLNDKETENFKQKMGLNIPVLLKSDPICRFYNFKKGSIIRIIRRSGFISYRIVK